MNQIADISAGELAKASLTSKATVVRLSQKRGLSGYQELKLKLIAEVNQNEHIGQLLANEPITRRKYPKALEQNTGHSMYCAVFGVFCV